MIFFTLLFSIFIYAEEHSEAFILRIKDRSINVTSPLLSQKRFSVILENISLTKQLGKFSTKGKNLKYVSVLPGQTETVEIENNSDEAVYFIPLSPSFQDVNLTFGKKAYEIPAKD